jgi:S-adenosylmethionine-diacylglycerol 3-amino-3-carboxypropyl transferase
MERIKYAQCWEDPTVLRRALGVGADDDVVSIASGGDNTLALLLDNPRSVAAVDMNHSQLHLLELKMRAIQNLQYDDFVHFVGARPCSYRSKLYRLIRAQLSDTCAAFWDAHESDIDAGVIHAGRFERYLATFRSSVLPLIHSRETINQLLASTSLDNQREIYARLWNSSRWQLLFRLFFSRSVMGGLGRDRSHFLHVSRRDTATELLRRTHRGLTEVPIKGNYFLEYALTGSYGNLNAGPPYLKERNFEMLRERVCRVRLQHTDLTRFLWWSNTGSFSRFNLSDILEYLSPSEIENLLTQLVRVSRPGCRASFWTLFNPRHIPSYRSHQISADPLIQRHLWPTDRGFFYGGFRVWRISSNANGSCRGDGRSACTGQGAAHA